MQTTTKNSLKAIVKNNVISATSQLILEIGENQSGLIDKLEIFAETCPTEMAPITFAQDSLFSDDLIPEGIKGKPMSVNSFLAKAKTDVTLKKYVPIYNLLNAFKTAVSRKKTGKKSSKVSDDKTRLAAILNVLKGCDNIPGTIEKICAEYNYKPSYETVIPVDKKMEGTKLTAVTSAKPIEVVKAA